MADEDHLWLRSMAKVEHLVGAHRLTGKAAPGESGCFPAQRRAGTCKWRSAGVPGLVRRLAQPMPTAGSPPRRMRWNRSPANSSVSAWVMGPMALSRRRL